MNIEELESKIKTEFKDAEVTTSPAARLNVSVDKEKLVDLANFVKHELGFLLPNMCTGIDKKDHIEVLWHIGNTEDEIILVLRTSTDRDTSEVPALTPIWKGMNWHERETFDLVGVNFVDHPDLRRLLLPDNWEGHPLREDYVYRKPNYRKLEDL
jgi:NADH-quinone oxidoreductase subunit C